MEAKVAGILSDRTALKGAVDALVDAGFRVSDISVAGRHHGETPVPSEQIRRDIEENPPGEHTAEGAVAGGILGGVAGLLLGLGGLALPGLGPLMAAGPIGAALGGTAVGASAGGLVGAIRDLGLTDEQVNGYMESIDAGAVLIAIHTSKDEASRAADILRDAGVQDIHLIRERDTQAY